MQFEISREAFIKPLQLVTGVVERRQTLPVLSNVLLALADGRLSLTGTDLEVELIGRVGVEGGKDDGEITVPARKLMDICKSLPEGSTIKFSTEEGKAVIKFGRSRFSLATLPATDFPSVEESKGSFEISVNRQALRSMLDNTGFAMAQQDVRYYLNGLLLEVTPDYLRAVATDGHRLALHTERVQVGVASKHQVIIPRKGVQELARLLTEGEEAVKLVIVKKHPELTDVQVKEFCRANLTGYKQPRIIEFRNELPKTPVGKILRRELRDGK